jgi:predicted metalloprotease with PDZ domain
MSSHISQLQNSPGRLVQTLDQASLDVWGSGTSGVGGNRAKSVSYYVKGPVVGFLLDSKIRRLTGGKKNLDDVIKLAYQRYSGERGFTADQFRVTAEEVASANLKDWFQKALASTEELDYTEALDWFGLRFTPPEDTAKKDEPAGTAEPAKKDGQPGKDESAKKEDAAKKDDARRRWRLEIRTDATDAQKAHFQSLLKPAA